MENVDPVIAFVLGAVLLLFGRRLFWLFVGAAGFVAAREFAVGLLEEVSAAAVTMIGVIAGVIGAVAAFFLQKLAIAAAGFLAGGYLALELVRASSPELAQVGWIAFIAGGLVGAILMAVLFRWTLIVLSSVLGAALISEALPLESVLKTGLFLVLAAVGVMVQARKAAAA